MRGTNRPLSDGERLKKAEATIEALQNEIKSLRSQNRRGTAFRQVEYARTVSVPAESEEDPPTYPTSPYAIAFVDMVDGGASDRSAKKQANAYGPIAGEIEEGSLVVVVAARNGQWNIIQIVPETDCNTFMGLFGTDALENAAAPAYAITIDSEGCLRRTPIDTCPEPEE